MVWNLRGERGVLAEPLPPGSFETEAPGSEPGTTPSQTERGLPQGAATPEPEGAMPGSTVLRITMVCHCLVAG
jgi:hypothetical protein